ncbi:MAG: Formiminotetrahydrofolate cyclodeaminase [Ignavibacteriae bacterium]|nr:MAG: Formiminotetrahydrofolate cyclodeaminase [Ignavibacteriota bacterium]
MLTKKTVEFFLDELASSSPAPGGGSSAALAAATGSALISMVCNLTIGKKKYLDVEEEMKKILIDSERIRKRLTELIDKDTEAFNKVMEAYSLPKESDAQKSLRNAAIDSALKEAALIPLEVMKHCVDALALSKIVAQKGNKNSISDAGVSALLLVSAAESAYLNVKINLNSINDPDFVGWKNEEANSTLNSCRKYQTEIMNSVYEVLEAKI